MVRQVVLATASEYERKCQRVDAAEFGTDDVKIEHVYGKTAVVRRRSFLRRKTIPITPLKGGPGEYIPEAVEERYFAPPAQIGTGVGLFLRRSILDVLDRTRARVELTRDDIEWHLFHHVPSPQDLAQVALWIDPAVDDDDFDGFVAEALVVGRIVVASRIPINEQRLEKGRTGVLVPPRDANELTHAILTALFKPELTGPRCEAARQTISKFRPRQRLRALTQLYDRLRS